MAEPKHKGSSPDPAGGSYTSPFGLIDRLSRPEIRIDVVPILDLAVIALLVSLLFTRFVALPGVRVDLPKTDLRMQHTASSVAILTIGNQGALYFDGDIYETQTIAGAMARYIERSTDGNVVLLIKAQARIELQRFLEICEMAQEAGFPQVQIIGARASAPVGRTDDLEVVPPDDGLNPRPMR